MGRKNAIKRQENRCNNITSIPMGFFLHWLKFKPTLQHCQKFETDLSVNFNMDLQTKTCVLTVIFHGKLSV